MSPGMSDNPYRLPRTTRPVHYALELEPDLSSATFHGTIAIDIEVLEPTDTVVLNGVELDVLGASADQGTAVEATAIQLDEDTERITLRLAVPLAPGPARLRLRFDGVLNDKLRGFYRSTYADDDGVEHTIATKTGVERIPCSSATPATTMPVTPLGVKAMAIDVRSSRESEPRAPSHAPRYLPTIETTLTKATSSGSKFARKSIWRPMPAK